MLWVLNLLKFVSRGSYVNAAHPLVRFPVLHRLP
jgi:hypothetical protein